MVDVNPVVWVHFSAAVLVIALAVPLIRRKVPRNTGYGIRLPASFGSDEAWFDINAYGGRALLVFGGALGVTAIAGSLVPPAYWVTYNFVALAIAGIGLAAFLVAALRYAKRHWPTR